MRASVLVTVLSLAAAAACATFGTDADDSPGGAATDAGAEAGDATAGDTGPGGPDAQTNPCDPTAPFESLRPVDGVNTQADESVARLSPDELVVYFTRKVGATRRLFRAVRTTRAAAFGGAEELTLAGDLIGAAPTVDDQALYYTVLAGNGKYDIFLARRNAPGEAFAGKEPVEVDGTNHSLSPFVTAKTTELWFDRVPIAGGDHQIFRAFRLADGGLDKPSPVAEINSTAFDGEAVLSFDELVVYFYTERARATGTIWRASRDGPGESFRTPVVVQELVPEAGDVYASPTWLSPDNCRLYFYTNVNRATTGSDIYVAERTAR